MHVYVIVVPLNSTRLQTTFHMAYQNLAKPEWITEHSKHPIYYPLKAIIAFFKFLITYLHLCSLSSKQILILNYIQVRGFKPVTNSTFCLFLASTTFSFLSPFYLNLHPLLSSTIWKLLTHCHPPPLFGLRFLWCMAFWSSICRLQQE